MNQIAKICMVLVNSVSVIAPQYDTKNYACECMCLCIVGRKRVVCRRQARVSELIHVVV